MRVCVLCWAAQMVLLFILIVSGGSRREKEAGRRDRWVGGERDAKAGSNSDRNCEGSNWDGKCAGSAGDGRYGDDDGDARVVMG